MVAIKPYQNPFIRGSYVAGCKPLNLYRGLYFVSSMPTPTRFLTAPNPETSRQMSTVLVHMTVLPCRQAATKATAKGASPTWLISRGFGDRGELGPAQILPSGGLFTCPEFEGWLGPRLIG
jgi:hypothetical protein